MFYANAWGSFYAAMALLAFAVAPPNSQGGRKVTKLAGGVYEIEHGAGAESGNTTVIIGDRQVFVVDTGFLPSAAREDIAQIRQWTAKPISFVLNTHFHNDHNFGNRIYLDAFPALTIIAHVETKKEMDMFGPSSADRYKRGGAALQQMLDTGKNSDGQQLSADYIKQVKEALARHALVLAELKAVKFQTATLTFDHDFTIDLGNREAQVKFLGRGNTGGDAVVYLPKEKIVVAGDLVVNPIPDIYDGYPSEWIQTLQNLAALDANTIVPGHGSIMHDKSYVFLLRDLMKSAVAQMDAKLVRTGPAMFQTLDQLKGAVDLTPFRERFAGNSKGLAAAFDDMAANLIKCVYEEDTLR
jgi:cyclase